MTTAEDALVETVRAALADDGTKMRPSVIRRVHQALDAYRAATQVTHGKHSKHADDCRCDPCLRSGRHGLSGAIVPIMRGVGSFVWGTNDGTSPEPVKYAEPVP